MLDIFAAIRGGRFPIIQVLDLLLGVLKNNGFNEKIWHRKVYSAAVD